MGRHLLLIGEPLLDLGHIRVGVVKLWRRLLVQLRPHLDLVSRREEGIEPQDEALRAPAALSPLWGRQEEADSNGEVGVGWGAESLSGPLERNRMGTRRGAW